MVRLRAGVGGPIDSIVFYAGADSNFGPATASRGCAAARSHERFGARFVTAPALQEPTTT
jgi:hypothetical protein